MTLHSTLATNKVYVDEARARGNILQNLPIILSPNSQKVSLLFPQPCPLFSIMLKILNEVQSLSAVILHH